MSADESSSNDLSAGLGTPFDRLPPDLEAGSRKEHVHEPPPDGAPDQELTIPIPPVPPDKTDPEIYAAWKKEMIAGFERNNAMFTKILDAFTRPYWLTVRMYQAMFVVGLLGFVLAAALGVWRGIEYTLVFGGLSAVAFIGFFISRPLVSLEQNIQFITWLGLIYNTYWTRLMYANDEKTIQADLESITDRAIQDLTRLLDKQAELTGKRPGLNLQASDSKPPGQAASR